MDNPKERKFTPLIRVALVAALVLGSLAIGATLLAPKVAQAQDEQPEEPTQTGPGMHGMRDFGSHGKFDFGGKLDYDTFLAEALGITVEELQAAQEAANAAMFDEAVAQGYITEEQVAQFETQRALMAYIDQDALTAKALGITVEELQAAREDGKSLSDMMEELGLEPADVRTAMQAAYEEAVQQAVEDGVITQEQADQILSGDFGRGFGMPGFDKGMRDFGPGGHGGRGDHGAPPGDWQSKPGTDTDSGATQESGL